MLCEIIDRYINVFFDEIQLKKENLKKIFWVPELGTQTDIPVNQMAWICHWLWESQSGIQLGS